jgi:hypothetical protein
VPPTDTARSHFLRGMELAKAADDASLLACLFYSAGRMHLYVSPPDTALALFQLGYAAALPAREPAVLALLEARQARAFAMLGRRDEAIRELAAARGSFERASADNTPRWVRFFDEAELLAGEGVTWAALGDQRRAVALLTESLRRRPERAVVWRAFDSGELAAALIRNGDISDGIRLGHRVVELVEPLSSRRARSRLSTLDEALRRAGRAGQELSERLAVL